MRVILYTGKGGVGKTSMAAATACHLSSRGKKTLIMSTDQAHSLADSFDCELGREPKLVMENLYAMEVDTVYESEKNWGSMKNYMRQMLTIQTKESIEVEELLVFPGLEELFSLFKILEIYEEAEYDVLIVDCAPTGETLSLLKYPEKLSETMEKVLPMKRKGLKIAGPMVEKVMKIPMPEDSIFDDFEVIMNRMDQLQKLMLNKEVLSLRIVTTPEKIVIREAKRNFTCLHLYDYNVDAIFINRIYPNRAMEGYFSKWILMQEEGLSEIKESFSEIPKFYVELQKEELRTSDILKRVGDEIFDKFPADGVLFSKEIYQVEQNEQEYGIRIYLPFAVREELELSQTQEELLISVKNEHRRYPLPLKVQRRDITCAKLEDGYLKVIWKNEAKA